VINFSLQESKLNLKERKLEQFLIELEYLNQPREMIKKDLSLFLILLNIDPNMILMIPTVLNLKKIMKEKPEVPVNIMLILKRTISLKTLNGNMMLFLKFGMVRTLPILLILILKRNFLLLKEKKKNLKLKVFTIQKKKWKIVMKKLLENLLKPLEIKRIK
jgi:hypothetical protein